MGNVLSKFNVSDNDDDGNTSKIYPSDDSKTNENTSDNCTEEYTEQIGHDICEVGEPNETRKGCKSRKKRKKKNKETDTNDGGATSSCTDQSHATAENPICEPVVNVKEDLASMNVNETRDENNRITQHPSTNQCTVPTTDNNENIFRSNAVDTYQEDVATPTTASNQKVKRLDKRMSGAKDCTEVLARSNADEALVDNNEKSTEIENYIKHTFDDTAPKDQQSADSSQCGPPKTITDTGTCVEHAHNAEPSYGCEPKKKRKRRKGKVTIANSNTSQKETTTLFLNEEIKNASDFDDEGTTSEHHLSDVSKSCISTKDNSKQIPADTMERDLCEVVESNITQMSRKARKKRNKKTKETYTKEALGQNNTAVQHTSAEKCQEQKVDNVEEIFLSNDIGTYLEDEETSATSSGIKMIRPDKQVCDAADHTDDLTKTNADEAHVEKNGNPNEIKFKMDSSISNLIQDGHNAKDSGDIKRARQYALQAMLGTTEAMEDFLKRENKDLSAQPLSDSFGACAHILHETKSYIPSIRCFYTATVFDDNWSVADHVSVSRILWDALLKQYIMELNQAEKVFEVLNKVYEIAELALMRQRFYLCTRICREIDEVYVLLVKQFQVCRLDRYYTAIKPVFLCSARSHYLTGEYLITGTMCATVLHEMCNFDCTEALELWSLCHIGEKEPELAESKLQLALKYAKDEPSKIRLQQLMGKVSKELQDINKNTVGFGTKPSGYCSDEYNVPLQPRNFTVNTETMTGKPQGKINIIQPDRPFLETSASASDPNCPVYLVENKEPPLSCTPVHCLKLEDVQEVTTFYERSRRFHRNEGLSEDINESVYKSMLEHGIKLNMSFMSQFEDKYNYDRDPYYRELESKDVLLQMLGRSNRFLRCEIHVESAHVSYCKPLDSTVGIETVEISGRSKAGQTFNGDECVVQLLDDIHDEKGKRYGRVEGILNRRRCKDVEHPVFLCTIDDMHSHLMRPICKTVPKISVLNQVIYEKFPKLKKYKVEIYNYDEKSQTLCDPEIIDVNIGDLHTYVFMVAYIKWSRRQIYPRGAVVKMLNCGETLTSGLMLLDLRHGVSSLYSRAVVDSFENAEHGQFNEISSRSFRDRDDLTNLVVFTIDPQGSKDLDDALNIHREGKGFKVGVHIADVSYFVKINDAIDDEARKRATTFYPSLPGKLPRSMLPEPLSGNAYSLLPNKCRCALSVFFRLSENGDILNKNTVDVRKTLIRSHEQFTYREVQEVIEGKHHRFKQEIMRLHYLARKIRKARLGNSMFAIDILIDDDDDVKVLNKTIEAHYIVEEFMVMANAAIARKLLRSFPDRVPLRCQPPPKEEHLAKFLQENGSLIDIVVKLQDKRICTSKTPCLTTLLGTSKDQNDLACISVPRHIWNIIKSGSQDISKVLCADDLYPLQHLIQQHWLVIRKSAEYKCSGGMNTEGSLKHYELDVYPYTHFTSPIRRYIDLVVHRLLHAAIAGKSSPYSRDEVNGICQHVNYVSKNAKDYQRACTSLKQAIELKKTPKMLYCLVDEITDRSITLASPDLKDVASKNRELAFNLLDMGYKPELETNPSTNISTITATWKKRLYDMTAVSTHMSDKKKNIMIDSNQNVVFVPLTIWARLLKCAVGEQFKDLERAVANTEAITLRSGNSYDVSTESCSANLQPNTTFSMTFKQGQMVKIQLSAVPLKGILTPRPMMYSMTNNVKLCLHHTDDPVLYLSRYFNRCTIDQYRDIELYLSRWIPLIEMEAATCAVANEDSCVVGNVPLRFCNEQEGKFSMSSDFCDERNIEFSGTISETDDGDIDDSAEAYDWLCLRYALSSANAKQHGITANLNSVWVGHAQITGVKRKNQKKPNGVDKIDKIVVNFKLHERCPALPSEARRKDSKFCVEILRKSEVDRRTESCLKRLQLPPYSNVLAYTIALNLKPIPPLDKFHVDLAKTIERDLYIPRKLPQNNIRQQEAIDKSMNHKLSLIQGPPGTGKTYTGIKLLYLFDKVNQMIFREKGGLRKQVLFCGPSNKSVDLVGNRLIDKLGNLCPRFVRVYGRSIEAKEFPIPGRSFISKKSTHALKADENLKSRTLHHLIREDGNQFAKQINAYDMMFKKNNYVASLEDVKEYEKVLRDASVEEIKKYGVILCTTAVGSNPKILKASNVYQVIVDEAGMCPEPQCLMPIIATKAEQVVLIGDHKQLRPIIICKEAAELGLQTSLFEKYVTSNSAKGKLRFTMLNCQYRMNPELCSFPSDEFYDGELKTRYANAWAKGDRLWYIWPTHNEIPYPHVLIPVEGEEEALSVSTDEGNEHSKSNLAEVDVVMKILRYFIEVGGVEGDQVNVMSQYNAQCAEIRKRIKGEGLQNCNASTVVSSQGGEWDYVIFSTVRSLPEYQIEKNPTLGWCQQNLGFITDKNQINVALTRARKGLIIIGNPNLLQCDEVFRNLISRYERYGCIKNMDEFPPPRTRLQKMDAADNRHWQLYGEARFIPGLGSATSYRGDVDNVPDHDDDDDDGGRRVFRRGKHKTLPARQK